MILYIFDMNEDVILMNIVSVFKVYVLSLLLYPEDFAYAQHALHAHNPEHYQASMLNELFQSPALHQRLNLCRLVTLPPW